MNHRSRLSTSVARHPATLTLLVAAVLGAAIWAASPVLTGHDEPWDAEGFFYVGALLVAGLASGALRPAPLWAHYLGAFSGQMAFQGLFLGFGPLVLIGTYFLAVFTLIFFCAAALSSVLRRRFMRPK